ncbi:related to mitochondrial import protein MPI1 precursor [Cephalotrichum gorgonifer]|uniref:Mitochondrial import inner membrane translocase subunit TIM44 n=1 Tax=Cephalotrichum gorgonifer TaxID=2041049 RepID=A0AAE8SWT1_9PEZI|nr:related to mitochondrial import protein MPI1 precursor [Cephalotrichum gorgonifer]
MSALAYRSGHGARMAVSNSTCRVTQSLGRAPAYRRISQLSTSTRIALQDRPNNQEHVLSRLRSPFTPESVYLASRASLQTRQFHATPLQSQSGDKKDSTSKTEETTAEQKDKEESGDKEKKEDSKSDGEKEEGKSKKEEEHVPPPPHGDKTPWEVFRDTFKSEMDSSKEWNESTKALTSSANQFAESESVRKAREAYGKTSGAVSSATAKVMKGTGGAIAKGATWTWETPVVKGVRSAANVTGEVLDKATKPIRDTTAYKNVKDVIDDGASSRYGGWVEKEERRKRREAREGAAGPKEVPQEDPNAGTNVTLHKDAAWKEAWRDFRDTSSVVQKLFNARTIYQESENPLISTARSITDTVGGWFAENETAQVIKAFREMDPSFQVEPFLQELREYILPEVLDAYVKGDVETLKLWLSAAQYSVYEALTKQYLTMGMKSDGRILDIRNVDILKAKMLDPGDVPVFIITCRTQEVHVYRNAKTNELAAGMEDKVQLVTYAIGLTRTPEDVNNPETRGWRLIEVQKSARDWT